MGLRYWKVCNGRFKRHSEGKLSYLFQISTVEYSKKKNDWLNFPINLNYELW